MNEEDIEYNQQTSEEPVQPEGEALPPYDTTSNIEESTDTLPKKTGKKGKGKKELSPAQEEALRKMREKLKKIREIKRTEKDEAKKQEKLDKLNIKAEKKKQIEKEKIVKLVPEILNDNKGLTKEEVRQLIKEEKQARKQSKIDAKLEKERKIKEAKELLGIKDVEPELFEEAKRIKKEDPMIKPKPKERIPLTIPKRERVPPTVQNEPYNPPQIDTRGW